MKKVCLNLPDIRNCLCSLYGKLDVPRDVRSLFYNARCEDDNLKFKYPLIAYIILNLQ